MNSHNEALEPRTMTDKPSIIAHVIASVAAALWNFPPLLLAMLAMMALDFISGVAVAGHRGELNSTRARKGIWVKISKLTAALGGYVVGAAIPPVTLASVDIPISLGSAICGAFIVAELISILENVDKVGGLPPRVKKMLGSFDDSSR
jgi:toxin secretion/phage lysis holin